MARTRRKYILATIVSLLGTAAIPVIVSGTASANNSRVCGREFVEHAGRQAPDVMRPEVYSLG